MPATLVRIAAVACGFAIGCGPASSSSSPQQGSSSSGAIATTTGAADTEANVDTSTGGPPPVPVCERPWMPTWEVSALHSVFEIVAAGSTLFAVSFDPPGSFGASSQQALLAIEPDGTAVTEEALDFPQRVRLAVWSDGEVAHAANGPLQIYAPQGIGEPFSIREETVMGLDYLPASLHLARGTAGELLMGETSTRAAWLRLADADLVLQWEQTLGPDSGGGTFAGSQPGPLVGRLADGSFAFAGSRDAAVPTLGRIDAAGAAYWGDETPLPGGTPQIVAMEPDADGGVWLAYRYGSSDYVLLHYTADGDRTLVMDGLDLVEDIAVDGCGGIALAHGDVAPLHGIARDGSASWDGELNVHAVTFYEDGLLVGEGDRVRRLER